MAVKANNTHCPWCDKQVTLEDKQTSWEDIEPNDVGQIYLTDESCAPINVHSGCMDAMLTNIPGTIEALKLLILALPTLHIDDNDNANALANTLRWFEVLVEDGIID